MEVSKFQHSDCLNASNPYHECVEYCFSKIDEAAKARKHKSEETGESDEEDVVSVISDSCVSVGKYKVRACVSFTLREILKKYGDIAENCQLKSASMRASHLECLCSVVQELHSTPFQQLGKEKVKEMFAVLKDLESAGIDVAWLKEILEAVQLTSQLHVMEAKKSDQERSLKLMREELESQLEDLDQKEREADDARIRVADSKDKLRALELEYYQLDNTVYSIKSTLEEFYGKSMEDELFNAFSKKEATGIALTLEIKNNLERGMALPD